jgi:hypothetical protein
MAFYAVNQMANLRHLSIMFREEQEYTDGHDLPLPP